MENTLITEDELMDDPGRTKAEDADEYESDWDYDAYRDWEES